MASVYRYARRLRLIPRGRTIARAIIGLTKSLGLAVIAKGVETQEQADFLRHEACHLSQGYLFGQPVPAAQLVAA